MDDSQDEKYCLCETVKVLYKKERKIIILVDDNSMEKFDNLLWSFEQNSFIPHKIYQDDDKVDAPVLIMSDLPDISLEPLKKYSTIINNTNNALVTLKNDVVIYEFVGHDENRKNISREKYMEYKSNKFELTHRNYQ